MWRFSVMLCFFIVITCCAVCATSYVSCFPQERDVLLAFKSELMISGAAMKLGSWTGFNCCEWHGVQCSQYSSHVIRLDFTNNYFLPLKMLHPALFQLKYMEHLDLGWNLFTGSIPLELFGLKELSYLDLEQNRFEGEIPVEIGSLYNLSYLNLGMNSFQGRIPWQLGNLSQLEFLDVSKFKKGARDGTLYGVYGMNLSSPSLKWVENLQNLRNLFLGGTVLNVTSKELEAALSPLHHLQGLELLVCRLSGHIPNAIQNLTSLSNLILDSNEFSSTVPSWLGSMPHLEELSLKDNPSLSGDVAHMLSGEWPKLTKFDMSGTNITGTIPPCIGNISSLLHLNIRKVGDLGKLEGTIPSSLGNISTLQRIDLNSNLLTGEIPPSLAQLSSLFHLDLGFNNLSGSVPLYIGQLSSLTLLDIGYNSLSGTIPFSIGQLSSLLRLSFISNRLSGQIPFSLGNMSSLREVYLDGNQLNGTIPASIGLLPHLELLYLSSNNLQGYFALESFKSNSKLFFLELSYNNLTVHVDPKWIPPFSLAVLYMPSCNIEGILPQFLSTQYDLQYLDLSENKLFGEIPPWLGDLPLETLNLSYNNFQGELPATLNIGSFKTLDLHRNQLTGCLPVPSATSTKLYALDLSQNGFVGVIPAQIGRLLLSIQLLVLSTNDLSGGIPSSIGLLQALELLDLSKNRLSGEIPGSITTCSSLKRLILGNNNFEGEIPAQIGMLSYLVTLQLNGNMLKGNLPSSLQNCSSLWILDVGDNLLVGNIPLWLSNFSELMILVLRSNKFQGHIPLQLSSLSSLHVLDISHNNLIGQIPGQLANLSGIMNAQIEVPKSIDGYYYKEEIQLTTKDMSLVYARYVLLLITCIDLSGNQLSNGIPSTLANLKGLHTLNLSRNTLSGEIPSSFGMFERLESLDLSNNELYGNIPVELQNLSFMSVFIVSNNMLCGRIPIGAQFDTFNPTYFSGNLGLCGSPINNKSCKCGEGGSFDTKPAQEEEDDEGEKIPWHWYVEWMASFATGFWGVFGILIFKRFWRARYIQAIDEVIINIVDRFRGV